MVIDIIHDLMKENSINDHYLDRYIGLIKRCVHESYEGEYYHNHHILPRSLYPEFTKDKWNLVRISPRLHLILHWCLHYALGGSMTSAYFQMCIHPKYDLPVTTRQYEKIANAFGADISSRKHCLVDGNLRRLRPDDPMILDGTAKIINKMSEIPGWVNKNKGVKRPDIKGTVCVWDVNGGGYVRMQYDEVDIINFIPAGIKRDEKSRKKTSESLSNRYHAYHKETGHRIYPKNGTQLPEGYTVGFPEHWHEKQSESMSGLDHYHNPTTGKSGRYKNGEEPEGWIKGRINFDNPFSNKVHLVSMKTGDGCIIDSGEKYERYCGVKTSTAYYTYEDNCMQIFSLKIKELLKHIPEHNRLRSHAPFHQKRDLGEPYIRGKHKGRSIKDLGYNVVPIEDWDYENDGDWEWVG